MTVCRLVTYREITGNVVTDDVFKGVRAAIYAGYDYGRPFHVIDNEDKSKMLWIGRPSTDDMIEATKGINEKFPFVGK